MQTVIMSETEIQSLSQNLTVTHLIDEVERYSGFQYFSPKSIGVYYNQFRKICQYIVALINDNIVGVLQLYPVKEKNVYAVSFIDVHRDHRNKGIAKTLYKCLNDYVESDWVIYGTEMSDIGGKCNLHQIRKRIVTNCAVYDDRLEYRYKHLGEKLDRWILEILEKREERKHAV